MRSRLRSWMANLTLLVAATVLTLLLVEFALRVTGHRMVFPQMVVEDSHTVYRLKPSARVRTINEGYFDYEYSVNSQGLRGAPNIVGAKSSPTQRILFLGDSFTFGVGVDDSATYPERVRARLRSWCDNPVETINAGVGGFGTSQELLYLQHYGWHFAPDVVVVGFMTVDPEDNSLSGLHRLVNGRLEDIPPSERPGWGLIKAHKHVPGYTWLVAHSSLFNWTRLKISSLAAQRAAAREAARESTTSVDTTAADAQEFERWRITAAIFDRLRAETDSHGARLVVAIIPHGGSLSEYYASGRDIRVDRMLDICRQQGLVCVNVSESIRRSLPTTDPRSLYLREGHFNATGYDFVADAVAKRLAADLGCTSPDSGAFRIAPMGPAGLEPATVGL
jgi:hypothetical protein